jgi:hypothetical protein
MEAIETKTANQLATGAPGSIELGGETYLVSQPTKGDFVTLNKELEKIWKAKNEGRKSSVIADIAQDLKLLPPEFQKMAMDSAMEAVKDRSPTKHELSSILFEREGVAFWAWLLIRKTQPSIKLATIRAGITDDNLDQICGQLLEANGLKEASPN